MELSCSISTWQALSPPFRPVPKLGRKIVAGLKSDEILLLLLCEKVVEVAEAGSVI